MTGLAAGVYTGDLSIHFAEANTTHHVLIVLIVVPPGSSAPKPSEQRLAAACPAKLVPVFTLLGQNFSAIAGWPTSLEVTVVDDCGHPMITGAVAVSFSSGDPLVSLNSLGDGRWSGTWSARANSGAPVTITARATSPPLQGTASIIGNLETRGPVPAIDAGGVINSANKAALLGPGGVVSIYGANLAQGTGTSNDPPFPAQSGGTQVILAGRSLPLRVTSAGLINAIVPYDVPVNATHQLIIQSGAAYSVPVPVTIATAGPAIFADQSGAGLVFDIQPDGTQFMVDADHPAAAGDTLVIYCAGLGAVDPPIPDGSAAPDSPPSNTTNTVAVTIGGQPATVGFAALAPATVGTYQIMVTMPDGVAPAPDVTLVVSVGGQDSPAATIAVQ
jgi:uncharacterized protein (TIGR03437 family)